MVYFRVTVNKAVFVNSSGKLESFEPSCKACNITPTRTMPNVTGMC